MGGARPDAEPETNFHCLDERGKLIPRGHDDVGNFSRLAGG